MRVIPVMYLWLFCLSICYGYRFLGIFPFHSKSHFVMYEHLMKGLARKGHQVDIISTFPLKKSYPNYNDIVKLQPPTDLVNNLTYEMMQSLIGSNPTHAVATLGGNEVCNFLRNPEIQILIREPPKDPSYDAVFIEVRAYIIIFVN